MVAGLSPRQLLLDMPTKPLFVGAWRVRHVIDESSPLHGLRSAADIATVGITGIYAVMQVSAAPRACWGAPQE